MNAIEYESTSDSPSPLLAVDLNYCKTKEHSSVPTSAIRQVALVFVSFCLCAGCGDGTGAKYPQHQFTSEVSCRVFAKRPGDFMAKPIGSVASGQSITIPSCDMWYIAPDGMPDMAAVARVLQSQAVPGLSLNHNLKDDDLAHLRGLAGLQLLEITRLAGDTIDVSSGGMSMTLRIAPARLTEAGLAHLSQLEGLRVLSLFNMPITDSGLAHLKNLIGLHELTLGGTRVGDAGLQHLSQMTNLEMLDLSRTSVTDAGLVHLANLQALQKLYLSSTSVTGSGLVHLANLQSLQRLTLNDTAVTDAGIANLQQFKALHNLALYHTRITDASVSVLKGLTTLREVSIGETSMSKAAQNEVYESVSNRRKPQR